MSFASILTVLTGAADDALTLQSAAALAHAARGEVKVVLAPPLAVIGDWAGGPDGFGVAPVVREAARTTQAALRRGVEALAREITEQLGLDIGEDAGRIVLVEEQSAHSLDLSRLALLTDLVVVGRMTLQTLGPWSGLVADALLAARVPVLAISSAPDEASAVAVIAWNGGSSAARAVRAALPLLKPASRVVILQDPEHLRLSDRSTTDPERLADYLRLHQVRDIEIYVETGGMRADGLVRQARNWDAGLVIAGAFEHSRLREDILGGVTASLVAESRTFNLFFAH
ncbi:universal stress protein [Caulobacter sp. 1776]|uniref:universal stress protein n=1 Tax=Caulobacter sp. 1776 TaxID=3156420 RepID=UPI003398D65B